MSIRMQAITIDAADPAALSRWWAFVLGWRVTYEDDDQSVVEPPAGSREDGVVADLLFVKVDDAKAGKNRVHLDLRPDDRDAEVARVEALGARRVDIGQGERSWVVLADPEGDVRKAPTIEPFVRA